MCVACACEFSMWDLVVYMHVAHVLATANMQVANNYDHMNKQVGVCTNCQTTTNLYMSFQALYV